jgi:YHS domain-containing protein
MKKITIAFLAASLVIFQAASHTFAGMACCGSCGSQKEAAGDSIVNDKCPVMGTKVTNDATYKVEYNGKKIGLCCKECVDSFNKEPEKYGQKALSG